MFFIRENRKYNSQRIRESYGTATPRLFFFDKRGLTHLPEETWGKPGFNFRHFGGTYKDCKTEYPESCGFDQVANVNLIRHNPASRRIIIDIWNGATQTTRPCHRVCVNTSSRMMRRKSFDLMIYLRSSLRFLSGNNWNVATGSFRSTSSVINELI